MSTNFMIGCVGKPSAGKSSFLNAATDANAKVGNYPFTTIEPNHGVTFYQTPCPCAKYGKSDLCAPRYGKCVEGIRFVPVKMLDVAGLVPGASEGVGLGNQFLDDLRAAHVLLHVVDASGIFGRTNEKGQETRGYDPLADVQWLKDEIHKYENNSDMLTEQLDIQQFVEEVVKYYKKAHSNNGYGANMSLVQTSLDALGIKEPSDLDNWDEAMVHKVVDQFMHDRFPIVLVLNKIDVSEADGNVMRICQKYPNEPIIPASALSECFLRKMNKEGYIRYIEGAENFTTIEDEKESGPPPDKKPLKQCDEKIATRLEKVKDLVLFRYGSTGVQQAIKKAVDIKQLIPVYPVKNIHNFTCDGSKNVFRDCILVSPGTTVRELCRMLSYEMEKHFLYAEGVDGQRLGEDEEITPQKNIIKFTTAAVESANVTHKEPPKNDNNNNAKPKEKTKAQKDNDE